MDNAKRKLLQEVQENRGWATLEEYLEEYISAIKPVHVKRDTEFDTIWELAENEGGIKHLRTFFASLEEEARKYN